MPKKSALVSKKLVTKRNEESDTSSNESSPPSPKTPVRRNKTQPTVTRARPSSPKSSLTKKNRNPVSKKRSSSSPSTPPVDESFETNADPDAYESDVIASSSSGDEDSDGFDPDAVSDPDSETAEKRQPAGRATSTTTGGGSSRAASPLESELDEEDRDIGLNYHAKSVSPKKRASQSPSKPKVRPNQNQKKNGKRKRDDYSDVAPSGSEEEEDDDNVVVEVRKSAKSKPATKKAVTKTAARSSTKSTSTPKKQPAKKRKTKDDNYGELNGEDDSDEERYTVVGKIIQAPTTGRVPPGQISQNTFNFLAKLADPECNDREWFKLHEPVFRLAEKEWKAFIEVLVPMVSDVDEQVPPLPPNDVIHRIYRDVRFSNDKTPYKRNFSASMSRSGRKGKFAGYHISIRPGGTLLAAGVWAPERDELANFRANIQLDSTPLREVISAPAFVELFGEAKPHPKGLRRNVFGNDDQLKVAPKGVAKDHPDIDLLKLRSVAVVHNFSDKEVLSPNFNQQIVQVMEVMRPLVHTLNDMISLPPDEGESE